MSVTMLLVRQVVPLHPGAVHVRDRVHDLAQVMLGRASDVQRMPALLGPPGAEQRLDQLPAGIGQVTRIRMTFGHDQDVPLVRDVRPGVQRDQQEHALPAFWDESGARCIRTETIRVPGSLACAVVRPAMTCTHRVYTPCIHGVYTWCVE